jgi:hypothetical protein
MLIVPEWLRAGCVLLRDSRVPVHGRNPGPEVTIAEFEFWRNTAVKRLVNFVVPTVGEKMNSLEFMLLN